MTAGLDTVTAERGPDGNQDGRQAGDRCVRVLQRLHKLTHLGSAPVPGLCPVPGARGTQDVIVVHTYDRTSRMLRTRQTDRTYWKSVIFQLTDTS